MVERTIWYWWIWRYWIHDQNVLERTIESKTNEPINYNNHITKNIQRRWRHDICKIKLNGVSLSQIGAIWIDDLLTRHVHREAANKLTQRIEYIKSV